MRLGALGKKVDVQWTIRQLIGEFELRGHSHAATLQSLFAIPKICSWRRLICHRETLIWERGRLWAAGLWRLCIPCISRNN